MAGPPPTTQMTKLPDEIAETPYDVVAFRLTHVHDEGDPESPGTLMLELAGRLRDTELDVVVPFEMSPETALEMADELVHQYRCLVHGLPDDEDEAEPEAEPT